MQLMTHSQSLAAQASDLIIFFNFMDSGYLNQPPE